MDDEHRFGAVTTKHDLNKAMHYADTILMLKDGAVQSYLATGQVTARMIESVYGLPVEIHHIKGYPMDIPPEERPN